jgi:thiol-disulfide isomerase/thioredoxin
MCNAKQFSVFDYFYALKKNVNMKQLFTLSLSLLILVTGFSQPKGKSTPKATTAATKKTTTVAPPQKAVSTIKTPKDESGGHDIRITLTPAKNQKVYLGCYYGKGNALIDSCILDDKSEGHFKGDKRLTGGIYFIVSDKYSIIFDLLVGDEQNFHIIGDTLNKSNNVVKGSLDNDIYKKHSERTSEIGRVINQLTNEYKESKNSKDSATAREKLKLKYKELDDSKDFVVKTYPNSLLATLLNAMRVPETPEIPYDSITKKYDSTYPYRFVKEHYFDDLVFADERLLRTPFFEKKIDDYLKYYVSPEADSIIPEIQYMLLSARESKEMYAYLLTKFTNKYINPEYMGQDKVFVKLFTDYYLTGDTTLLDTKSRKTIIDRGYSMMLNQLGSIAPSLDLTDTTGKVISLYSLKSKFTFIAYWDPTCGHCRTEIPVLDSIYKAKWKNMDVTIYSITSKDDLIPELKKFIKEKNLPKTWLYTYETKAAKEATEKAGVPNFRQAYDLNKTPIFYLLDADKRIIAKNLTIQQIDDLIMKKSKMTK